ncbi:MAG: glutaredoxin, partial [Chloroflexi bacterium]|nr:glutaredoxin [Chloroflexota bacterium]
MALIDQNDAQIIRDQFAEKLQRPVKLVVVTTQSDCMYCNEVQQLTEE